MKATEVEVADVFRGSTYVGQLRRRTKGCDFEYDDEFLRNLPNLDGGIAFHLPFSKRKIETRGVNLHPFFAGLLPEGVRLGILIKRAKTSADDLMSLLIESGSDCIGDVYILPKGSASHAGLKQPLVDPRRAQDMDFEELLKQALGEDGDLDVTIPGVQDKISAGRVTLSIRDRKHGPLYILKLNPHDRPNLVENEAYCMSLATQCGLRVASTIVIKDRKEISGLLVNRFDRVVSDGAIQRVHQEDGCQFLDLYPSEKYRIPARRIAEGIAQFASAPKVEIVRFLKQYLFSYLISNGDFHAKNISLYKNPSSGLIELTPAYDLLSTAPYKLDQSMPMQMEGKGDRLREEDFLTFGKRFGLTEKAILYALNDVTYALTLALSRSYKSYTEVSLGPHLPKKDWLAIQSSFEERYDFLSR